MSTDQAIYQPTGTSDLSKSSIGSFESKSSTSSKSSQAVSPTELFRQSLSQRSFL